MEILQCLLCGVVNYTCHAHQWYRVHKQGHRVEYLCDACFGDVSIMASLYQSNQSGDPFLKQCQFPRQAIATTTTAAQPSQRRWSNGRLLHPNDALHQSVRKKGGGTAAAAAAATNRSI